LVNPDALPFDAKCDSDKQTADRAKSEREANVQKMRMSFTETSGNIHHRRSLPMNGVKMAWADATKPGWSWISDVDTYCHPGKVTSIQQTRRFADDKVR
jgi:hypothetical protein